MGWNKIPNAGAAKAQGFVNAGVSVEKKGAPFGQNRSSVITDQVVREIRALSDFKGWKRDALSKRYGLSPKQVGRILSGYTASNVLHSQQDIPF